MVLVGDARLLATDRRESEKVKAKTAAEVRRIWEAAERIRRMTELYRERLEGTLQK